MENSLKKVPSGSLQYHKLVVSFAGAFTMRVGAETPMFCANHGNFTNLNAQGEWELYQHQLYGGVCDKFAHTTSLLYRELGYPSAQLHFCVPPQQEGLDTAWHTMTLFQQDSMTYLADADHCRLFADKSKSQLLPAREVFQFLEKGQKDSVKVLYFPAISQFISKFRTPLLGNCYTLNGKSFIYGTNGPFQGYYLHLSLRDTTCLREDWGQVFPGATDGKALFQPQFLRKCIGDTAVCSCFFRELQIPTILQEGELSLRPKQ
ncbi:MAG: hypothetical protein H6581_21165 [Bacteroidia bacterium]|nr:hypothetical protein [Bacteroidia bacterium]